MTTGVGGTTAEQELEKLRSMRAGVTPISIEERRARIEKAQSIMRDRGIQALYLDASSSLYYFTGTRFWASERLHGAVLPAQCEIAYLSPAFEEEKTRAMLILGDDVRVWEEHEDPAALVIDTARSMGIEKGTLALDEATPFFVFDGLRNCGAGFDFINGAAVTAASRMHKSPAELALMQRAKDITLHVHEAAARILHEGITTTQVAEFITTAHLRLGSDGPPTFCIVLFGEPTANARGGGHGSDRYRRPRRRVSLRHHPQLCIRRTKRSPA